MCENHEHPHTPLENLRQPMPLLTKARLVLTNNLLKIKNRSSCCGNLGQPGC